MSASIWHKEPNLNDINSLNKNTLGQKLGIEFTGVQNSIICKADACRNGFDIQATKQ